MEIKQFQGQSVQTLVPRVFGSTEKLSRTRGRKLTQREFLDDLPNEGARAAALRLLAVTQQKGGITVWGPSGVTLKAQCSQRTVPLSVAWFYPPSKTGKEWLKTREFTFGEAVTAYEVLVGEEVCSILQRWTQQFEDDSFTEDASSKGVTAWSLSYDDVASHIDVLERRLARVLSKLAAV